jgi:uncharacterized membrane protein
MHMDQYFVLAPDGREYGPVDLPGLLQWLQEGRVLNATLIRKNDDTPVPAETLPELAVAFSPPPPQAIPPFVTSVALPAEFRSWDFIGQAWELVKPHWLPLAAMFLIVTAIGCVPYAGGCAMFVIGGAIYVGISRAILGVIAGRTPSVGMMFEGFDRFGQAFLAALVTGLLIGLGTLLLIVPGIILAIMWMFVSLVLAETNLEFWPAMEYSANLTAGYRWELFCLMLACLVVGILGMLACCVGIFVAQPVIFTAIALAYRFLQARQAARAA